MPAFRECIYNGEGSYGATMPEHSCFIAFNGRHGLMGRHMTIDELKNSSVEKIKTLVANNSEGLLQTITFGIGTFFSGSVFLNKP
jgi:hypothetical protein